MRLAITAGPPDIWVGLVPETGEEGVRRPGRVADVIVRLQALATRLGFPLTLGDAADLA
jgi:hypothetical protein